MYALCTSNVLAMSCAFRFIWIIILAHFSTGDDCRKIEFADRLENKALINHVIISFREIEEEMCEIKCYLEPYCRSYNYGLLTNGTFLCELSDTQHMQALPGELEARNGFNYRSIEQDSCLSSPCSRNATCRAGFGDHGYLCVCPSSYYGDRCQLETATTSAVSSTALTTESFHQTSPIVPLPTVATLLNPSAASLTSSTIVSIQSSASVVSASCEAQWTGFGSSCYKIHSYQDWSNAKLNCQNFGGKLVKIESEDENHFIKTKYLSGGGGRYWIGLSDLGNESDWRWTDGTGITGYEKWRSGQPNNHEGNQHCGAILKGNYYSTNYNAEWNDEKCSLTLDYICEK